MENAGYRAPSCLLTDTGGLKAISQLDTGYPVLQPLLDAANVNSRYRLDNLQKPDGDTGVDEPKKPDGDTGVDEPKKPDGDTGVDEPGEDDGVSFATGVSGKSEPAAIGRMLLLGRRRRIAHGGAAGTSPGEEPVDLAISVPPSLEVIGETKAGNIELAVRIRFAPGSQIKTASSVSLSLKGPSAAPAPNVLDDYLAECKGACDGEVDRLFASGQKGASRLYELILDYPRRGGKALRPALSIATCLGLGGHLEAVLPTAATLELYHNAFLVHDDIEDESWRRRGRPTLHIDHGIPIAVNVGDAMLSLSLQPLSTTLSASGLGRPYASCGPSRT